MSVISEPGKYLSIALFFSEISHILVCLGRWDFRWVLLEMQLGYGKSERGRYSAGALVLDFPLSIGFFSPSHRTAVLLPFETRIGNKAGTAYGITVCVWSV